MSRDESRLEGKASLIENPQIVKWPFSVLGSNFDSDYGWIDDVLHILSDILTRHEKRSVIISYACGFHAQSSVYIPSLLIKYGEPRLNSFNCCLVRKPKKVTKGP